MNAPLAYLIFFGALFALLYWMMTRKEPTS